MKRFGCLILLLALAGCSGDILKGGFFVSEEELRRAEDDKRKLLMAQFETDLRRLQDAVKSYAAENRRLPRTLSELQSSHIESIPLRPDGKPFGYNPVTGEVYKSADGPAAEDYLMMEQIALAIRNYGMSTGYYPATLDALYPSFLPQLPRTASGQPFAYNSQNGEFTHPDEGKQYNAVQLAGPQPAVNEVLEDRQREEDKESVTPALLTFFAFIAVLLVFSKLGPGTVRFVKQVRGYKRSNQEEPPERFGDIAAVCGLPFFVYGTTYALDIFVYFHGAPRLYENPLGFIIAYGFWSGLAFHVAGGLLIGVPVEWVLRKIFDP